MTSRYRTADAEMTTLSRRRFSRLSAIVPWSLLLLVLAGAGAFYWFRYRPLEHAYASTRSTLSARGSELEDVRSGLSRLRRDHEALESDRTQLAGQLKQAVLEKNAALEELKRTKADLSDKLGREIAAGDISISQKGDDLVVDVADKVLFPAGEADVTERGQKVLEHVAGSLKTVKSHVFEVGGHTDSAPIVSPKTLERYPTNWELSAARATNVVRFLVDQGVPGHRLVAAGFAENRPVASNASPSGRQRNRRIEIVLSRPPKR